MGHKFKNMKKTWKKKYIETKMPRRSNQEEMYDLTLTVNKNEPVSDFLKNTYYNMKKRLDDDLTCAICLEKIDCERCMCVLTCGHFFHLHEILKLNFKCPVCRS